METANGRCAVAVRLRLKYVLLVLREFDNLYRFFIFYVKQQLYTVFTFSVATLVAIITYYEMVYRMSGF